MTQFIRLLAAATSLALILFPSAASSDPEYDGGGGGDSIWVSVIEASQAERSKNPTQPIEHGDSPYVDYQWSSVCVVSGSMTSGGNLDCPAARSCADALERQWRLWGRTAEGTWNPLYTQCFGRPPTAADTPVPTVTPGLVLTALRQIGLPAIQARTQPADKTLVNFETIFFAEPETFSRTITLLGQRVDVEAQPTQFLWHHGDGTTATTTTPGAPYPAKDITYEYTDAHQTVQASVDVVYTARFRVGNGAWQNIAETVTIAGPPTPLRISEATPVLSGSYG